MQLLKVLQSEIDDSVNFINEAPSHGFFESRYVRRSDDYFICYLSSQSGCNRGCRFCHLTTTKQTLSDDAWNQTFFMQALPVFEHYEKQKSARFVHFNFMARGEPLANDDFVDDADDIMVGLGGLAASYGLPSRFNVSTIVPSTLKRSLIDVFKYVRPTIYYSLYSVNDDFRRKWLPGAMDVERALGLLKEYQIFSTLPLKIHYALIDGENDRDEDVADVLSALERWKIQCDFNIVRYNPPDGSSRESSTEAIERAVARMRAWSSGTVNVVPRVGLDVFASCGMFVKGEQL